MSLARDIADLGSTATKIDGIGSNVIINGAMTVSQRATSVTGITGSGYNTVDRWRVGNSSAGTWTMAKTAVTDLPSFRNSLKMDCTTADGSLGANDNLVIEQRFEGQNVQQFQKGTSSAKSWTLSFYVKGTTTGTYICQLFDNDNNRFVSKSYTISSANTWEYKTITFPPDTTGAINDSNGNNFIVSWYLAAGSNLTSGSLQTAWAGNTAANKAVGQVNLAASTSNDWQMTGVQLEVGTNDSDFEHKSLAENLMDCQRYYFQMNGDNGDRLGIGGYAVGASEARMDVVFPCSMRAAPTISGTGTAQFDATADSADFNVSAVVIDEAPTGIISSLGIQIASSSMTAGQSGGFRFRSTGTLSFAAEL